MTTENLDVRSLSGTMAKILLVFLFERGGMTIDELAYRTGVRDLKTLRLACKDMSRPEMGLLVSQSGAHGKETWLPAGALLPEMRQAYFPERGNPPLCLADIEIQNGGIHRSDEEEQPNSLIKNVPGRGIPPTWSEKPIQNGGFPHSETGSIMMIDESLNHQNQDSSIMNPEKQLTVALLLESAEILFGDTLDLSEIPTDLSTNLVLAWIVKVYTDRSRLTSPIGLLRSRLCSKQSRSLPKDWQDRLPGEFLAAIGVTPREINLVAQPDQEEVEDPDENYPAQINPILDQRRQNGGMSINQAWESVLSQLRMSMPRSSFDNFVSQTMPIDWSEETGELIVASKSAYARDWLESRLQSTCLRLLAGMLNRSVELRFITNEVKHELHTG